LSADLGRYLDGHPVSLHLSLVLRESRVDTGDPLLGPWRCCRPVLRVEEKSDEFLGMGMADAIITKLSNIPSHHGQTNEFRNQIL